MTRKWEREMECEKQVVINIYEDGNLCIKENEIIEGGWNSAS